MFDVGGLLGTAAVEFWTYAGLFLVAPTILIGLVSLLSTAVGLVVVALGIGLHSSWLTYAVTVVVLLFALLPMSMLAGSWGRRRRPTLQLQQVGPATCDEAEVGSKVWQLAAASRSGRPVVPGFVITRSAWERCRRYSRERDPEGPLQLAPDVLRNVRAQCDQIRSPKVIFRSSFSREGQLGASFAGQFDSLVLETGNLDVQAAVLAIWASAQGQRVRHYAAQHGLDIPPVGGILVQPWVAQGGCGMATSDNAIDGAPHEALVTIETHETHGNAAAVFAVNRLTGGIRAVSAGAPAADLDFVLIEAVARLAIDESDRLGATVEIEWVAVDGQPLLLQSRRTQAATDSAVYLRSLVTDLPAEPLSRFSTSFFSRGDSFERFLGRQFELLGIPLAVDDAPPAYLTYAGRWYLSWSAWQRAQAHRPTARKLVRALVASVADLVRYREGCLPALAAEAEQQLPPGQPQPAALLAWIQAAQERTTLAADANARSFLFANLFAGVARQQGAWLVAQTQAGDSLAALLARVAAKDRERAHTLAGVIASVPAEVAATRLGEVAGDVVAFFDAAPLQSGSRQREWGLHWSGVLPWISQRLSRRYRVARELSRLVIDVQTAKTKRALAALAELAEVEPAQLCRLTLSQIELLVSQERWFQGEVHSLLAEADPMHPVGAAPLIVTVDAQGDLLPVRPQASVAGVPALVLGDRSVTGVLVDGATSAEVPPGSVVLLPDSSVTWAGPLLTDCVGVVVRSGSPLSHLATIARERGIAFALLVQDDGGIDAWLGEEVELAGGFGEIRRAR